MVLQGFGVDLLLPWAAAWDEAVLERGFTLRWSFLRCPGIYF